MENGSVNIFRELHYQIEVSNKTLRKGKSGVKNAIVEYAPTLLHEGRGDEIDGLATPGIKIVNQHPTLINQLKWGV